MTVDKSKAMENSRISIYLLLVLVGVAFIVIGLCFIQESRTIVRSLCLTVGGVLVGVAVDHLLIKKNIIRYIDNEKMRLGIKKIFTLKNLSISVASIAILAVIAIPRYIQNSRNETALKMLQQIALAEMALQSEDSGRWDGVYTDGVDETAESAVTQMVQFGFRPDPSVAFHITRPGVGAYGFTPTGFVAFAAHNSNGSTVYVYDNVDGGGVVEVRQNDTYAQESVKLSDELFDQALHCYEYDPADKEAPVTRNCNATKFGPDPKDAYPARMVITVVGE